MKIIDKYKDGKIYREMNDDQKKSFDSLVEFYGEFLNKGLPIGKTMFTAHDFNNHCNNIYNIINDIILYHASSLKEKEYYILNIAVLFHDISLSTNINFKRYRHSEDSSEYIKKEAESTQSNLHREITKSLLNRNDIKTIREIVKAHSDIKDETGKIIGNGVYCKELTSTMAGHIDGKALAAILRLADELDVTSERLGTEFYSSQLSPEDEEQRLSMQHWERLHYFSEIRLDEKDTTLLWLVCDDEYITDHSDNIQNICENILNIIRKIDGELQSLNAEVFSRPEYARLGFRCNKIKVKTNIDEINSFIATDPIASFNFCGGGIDKNNRIIPDNDAERSNSNENASEETPNIISKKSSDKLNQFIIEKNLLTGGHYILNDTMCVREWIDTKEIIETDKICSLCIHDFAKHFKNLNCTDDIIVVGLDLEGSILASLLALELKLPFQYIIPAKSIAQNSKNDINFSLPKEKKIILVTDAICTFNTINSVIEKHGLKDKVIAIYTLVYTMPESGLKSKSKISKELCEKTFCINKDFPMNLYPSENCQYKKQNRCIARNKKTI